MIGALDLADSTSASLKRRQFGVPAALVGRDMDDATLMDMRVDDTASAAIMAASAGDDAFARPWRGTRCFVDDLAGNRSLRYRPAPCPVGILPMQFLGTKAFAGDMRSRQFARERTVNEACKLCFGMPRAGSVATSAPCTIRRSPHLPPVGPGWVRLAAPLGPSDGSRLPIPSDVRRIALGAMVPCLLGAKGYGDR